MGTGRRYRLEILTAETALQTGEVVEEWDRFVRSHSYTKKLFASPTWVAHLAATTESPVHVCLARDEEGQIAGAGAILCSEYELKFETGTRVLLRKKLRAARIPGGLLVLPEVAQLHADAIGFLLDSFPDCDCLYAAPLPTDTYFWQFLADARGSARDWRLYVVEKPQPWHLTRLAPSFEAYVGAQSARRHWRRKLRRLSEAAEGDLQLCRVTAPEEVPRFLEEAASVSRDSWQGRTLGQRVKDDEAARRSLEDLACRGVLRSYLLRVGRTPVAFLVGYQYCGVYHGIETGYSEEFGQYAPGIVLMFLMLEDLHTHDRPDVFHLGSGDQAFKREFGNCERGDACCLIVRRRFWNVAATSSHALFSGAVRSAKRLVGGRIRLWRPCRG